MKRSDSKKKNKVLYKESRQGKFKKFEVSISEGQVIFRQEKSKKEKTSPLLTLQLSGEILSVKTKEPGINLWTINIESENRRDKIGTENKEDLEEWIQQFNDAKKKT